MKKAFCFLILIFTGLIALQSQTFDQWVNDTVKDQKVLLGYGSRAGLEKSDFKAYFSEEYQNYNPDEDACFYLGRHIDSLGITIVLGTWCHDSQEQVPRFFKVLDHIDFNAENLVMIGVDGNKQAGEVDISGLEIELVPTFIFYKNDIELGRIIETPMTSLEEDMLLIIRNQ